MTRVGAAGRERKRERGAAVFYGVYCVLAGSSKSGWVPIVSMISRCFRVY